MLFYIASICSLSARLSGFPLIRSRLILANTFDSKNLGDYPFLQFAGKDLWFTNGAKQQFCGSCTVQSRRKVVKTDGFTSFEYIDNNNNLPCVCSFPFYLKSVIALYCTIWMLLNSERNLAVNISSNQFSDLEAVSKRCLPLSFSESKNTVLQFV